MPNMNGSLIRALLEREALTREDFAELAKVSIGVIDKALAGKSIGAASHEKIASVLKVPTPILLRSERISIAQLEQDAVGVWRKVLADRDEISRPVDDSTANPLRQLLALVTSLRRTQVKLRGKKHVEPSEAELYLDQVSEIVFFLNENKEMTVHLQSANRFVENVIVQCSMRRILLLDDKRIRDEAECVSYYLLKLQHKYVEDMWTDLTRL